MANKGTTGGQSKLPAGDAKCPDTIKRLIDRFSRQTDTICSPDYNETLIRVDFINSLMRELGWDIDKSAGYAERYRSVALAGRSASRQTPHSGLHDELHNI